MACAAALRGAWVSDGAEELRAGEPMVCGRFVVAQAAVGFGIPDFGNDRISPARIVARLAQFRALSHGHRSFHIAAVTSAQHSDFHRIW